MVTTIVVDPRNAVAAGININSNGGAYKNGKAYGILKKIELVDKYDELSALAHGMPPSFRVLAAALKVSVGWASKVIRELQCNDGLVDHDYAKPQRFKGPGSLSLDSFDIAVLLRALRDNPTRSLRSYQRELFDHTGTIVSVSTISRFWKHGFDIRATLRKPDLVPIDKFKPENIERAMEYIQLVLLLDARRLKFCDEKSLKGEEMFLKKVRRDPITGITKNLTIDSDFRNTYSITGFCGVDPTTRPMFFNINEQTNDATDFAISVEQAIACGFLKPSDILVLDNARIHSGGENDVLEDFLWNQFGIHLLWLPTRSPELNPIELIWNILVQRLKAVDIFLQEPARHRVANHAFEILQTITQVEVAGCYRKCGYNV